MATAFLDDEIPAMVDNLRFFAGRNSHLAPRLRHGRGDGLRTTAGSLEQGIRQSAGTPGDRMRSGAR